MTTMMTNDNSSSNNLSAFGRLLGGGGGGGGLACTKLFVDVPVADAAALPLVLTAGALLARAARGATFGDALAVLSPGLAWLQELLGAAFWAVANNVVLPPRLLALLFGGDASIKCVTLIVSVWTDGRMTNVDLCERGRALVDRIAARGDLPLQMLHIGLHQPAQHPHVGMGSTSSNSYLPPCRLIAGNLAWRCIDGDVMFRCRRLENSTAEKEHGCGGGGGGGGATRFAYDIGSRRRSAAELQAWVDRLTADAQADAVASGVITGARYHFVYRGHCTPPKPNYYDAYAAASNTNRLEARFTKSVIAGNGVRCFDSLDRVHHPHVARLRRDLALLDDEEHFARHGGRRKKGYLFSGPPGCCKTATVAAMAAESGRHIMEVPWSRIFSNADLEDLMSLRCIDGVQFHPRQMLVFFDEIDGGGDLFEDKKKKEGGGGGGGADAAAPSMMIMLQSVAANDGGGDGGFGGMRSAAAASPAAPLDKLHVGAVLACLDGVANHDGLVIVAATNHPEKLPEAMKRTGRLTHLEFDYMRPEDAVALARDYFALTETEARELAAAMRSGGGGGGGGGARLSGAILRDLCERSCDARELITAVEAELADAADAAEIAFA